MSIGNGLTFKDGALCCSHCGFNYIYHTKTEVFEREGEDVPKGIHVIIGANDVKIKKDMKGNPSPRRDGIKIYLSCENCDKITVLTIVQHKGNTYLDYQEGK